VQKKTSVIIPFYNNEHYIEEAITSLLIQTVPPKEIIVVNDGSTHESRQFLNKFSAKVSIIDHKVNKGIAHARNTGAEHSTGEYLAFLDGDDLWEPNKIEIQQVVLEKEVSVAGCHTGVYVFNKNKSILEICNDKPIILDFKNSAVESHVVPSSFMIRKSAFVDIGGFDPKVRAEDYDFFLSLLTKGYRIKFIPKTLTWLRRDDHGNESNKWQYIFYGRIDVFKKHWKILYKYNGLLSLLIFIQRTCEMARWRASKPLSYLFMILAKILPNPNN